MKITTSRGKTIEATTAMTIKMRSALHLLIVLPGDTPLRDAAEALDGLEWLRAEGENAGVSTTYEGYSRIRSIARAEDGGVRVTLTREE